ncbi:hypothetical protein GCK72_023057 [Caenorhabditis remanei]|uniref:[histone H4]-lysine(20) N-methyltransferase n=1 Tax=Caenorhabditis remanei TaxID=31234 RepID=A0A6A5FVE1_CAERE|nr:hypothetical protein GCK72_023057 [Caenorhabditis remanei]KAF1746600.1 hypothetical protein GCK72_023057 [Caenorhabditis remanei]
MRRRKPWTVKKRRPRPRKTASDSAASPKRIRKPPAPKDQKTPLITEFFKVRRSGRKTKKQLKRETELEIHQKVLNKTNEPLLEIFTEKVKGRGIKTTVPFEKGDFVVEYKGDLVEHNKAKEMEEQYSKNEDIGSYMFFFEYLAKKWCVDATAETPYKGRLVNHSKLRPNLKARAISIDGAVHLILVAKSKIEVGEELLYDYGDRSSEVTSVNTWLLTS